MKKCLLFLSFYSIYFTYQLTAQNLVPNPNFELVLKMPSKENPGINCAKQWRTPTFSGSDYYHAEAEKCNGTPKNRFGNQKPHSGKAYGGICVKTDYYEYLSAILTDTLIKGQDYLVEFYYSKAEKSKGSLKELGILFTNKISLSLNYKGISEQPSIDFTNPKGYKNKKDWTKISTTYRAEGFETVIILGHFNYDNPNGRRKFCHYYIDDVLVTPILQEKDSLINVSTTNTQEKIDSLIFLPKHGEAFTLKNIFFETNMAQLLSTSYPELDNLVQYLNKEFNTSIQIIGHTDNSGNDAQNKILSEKRAKAVSDYLTSKGIDKTRITYFGYGSAKPINSNNNEDDKKQNRRVEVIINKK